MAISPVSDIVLEVARAADPASYRAAAARLARGAGTSAPPKTFEEAMGGARSPAPALHMPFNPALAVVHMRNNDSLGTRPAGPYEKFEAFVLQTFIQSMLPENSEALFGSGTAGEIWRSMLAEGLGTQLARTGGIGIARMLAAAGPETDRTQGVAEKPVSTTPS